MGQYFKPVVFTVNEKCIARNSDGTIDAINNARIDFALKAHDFEYEAIGYNGNKFTSSLGLKLMEHSYIGNYTVNAVEKRLGYDARCKGFRVVWAGDYSKIKFNGIKTAYRAAGNSITDESFKRVMKHAHGYDYKYYKYLLNLDKKQYVVVPRYTDEMYQIHPLPLLTADSNYEYCGINENLVGAWCGDRIRTTNRLPGGYTELKAEFKENE